MHLANFDTKQRKIIFSSRILVTLVQFFVLLPSGSTLLVGSLLLDLDPYGGIDPDGMFQLFHKQMTGELAPQLAVTFRPLIRGSSDPAGWRFAMLSQCQ